MPGVAARATVASRQLAPLPVAVDALPPTGGATGGAPRRAGWVKRLLGHHSPGNMMAVSADRRPSAAAVCLQGRQHATVVSVFTSKLRTHAMEAHRRRLFRRARARYLVRSIVAPSAGGGRRRNETVFVGGEDRYGAALWADATARGSAAAGRVPVGRVPHPDESRALRLNPALSSDHWSAVVHCCRSVWYVGACSGEAGFEQGSWRETLF